LIAGGEVAAVREQMLQLSLQADSLVYRIGVWRVLASTSATLPERAACVEQVEKIFLNPASPDRSQALETLCKLRHRVAGPALAAVRELAANPAEPLRGLALWALTLAGEAGARDSFVALLQSPEEGMRLVAAYGLRLMRASDPAVLAALAQAAAREPASTRAYPYLASAAFSLDADPARRGAWRARLEKILADESAADAFRFEACQSLLPQLNRSDRPAFGRLLASAGPDTRVGAALVILSFSARP